MSKHKLHDKPKFTLQSLIRLVVFFIVIFFTINYLSRGNSGYNVLSATSEITSSLDSVDISKYVPQDSSVIIYLQDKYNTVSQELQGFPQKQIKEIQKQLLKQTYQDILDTIESK